VVIVVYLYTLFWENQWVSAPAANIQTTNFLNACPICNHASKSAQFHFIIEGIFHFGNPPTPLEQQSLVGQDLLIIEASQNTPDNTQHSQEKGIHVPGGI